MNVKQIALIVVVLLCIVVIVYDSEHMCSAFQSTAQPATQQPATRSSPAVTQQPTVAPTVEAKACDCCADAYQPDDVRNVSAVAVYMLNVNCEEKYRAGWMRDGMPNQAYFLWHTLGVTPLFLIHADSCIGREMPTFPHMHNLTYTGIAYQNGNDLVLKYNYTIPVAASDEYDAVWNYDRFGERGWLPPAVLRRDGLDPAQKITVEVWVRHDYSFPLDPAMANYTRPLALPHCDVHPEYILGTRFYVWEMWLLPEIQQFDYVFKVDYDVHFFAHLPLPILDDMARRGAVLGHSHVYLFGEKSCARYANECVQEFVDAHNIEPCSAGVRQYENEGDAYFSNFIVMSRKFFSSSRVLAFAKHMHEWPRGFSKERWGDQIYFHKALGLFLGPKFDEQYVADYSAFRCFVTSARPTDACQRGVFAHVKGFIPLEYFLNRTHPARIAPKEYWNQDLPILVRQEPP